MPTDLAALTRFIDRAPKCASVEILTDEFGRVMERFGVKWFNVVHIADFMAAPSPRTLFGRPETFWSEHYAARRYFEVDPCIPRSLAWTSDFTWSEAMAGYDDPRVLRMFAEARECGPAEGLIVPMREINGAMTGVRLMTEAPDFAPNLRPMLHIASHYYAMLGRALLGESATPERECPLSPREVECLSWAGQGKTAWETGRILNVSATTVQKHMDNAKVKLGVNSRMLAVIEALKHGWLEA